MTFDQAVYIIEDVADDLGMSFIGALIHIGANKVDFPPHELQAYGIIQSNADEILYPVA